LQLGADSNREWHDDTGSRWTLRFVAKEELAAKIKIAGWELWRDEDLESSDSNPSYEIRQM